MLSVKLKIDTDLLTLDDMIALESGFNARTMRDVFARFVVDEKGKSPPEAEARAAVGKLTLKELKDVAQQFSEAMKDMQASAVPPPSGGA
jgi:hypothetical protein